MITYLAGDATEPVGTGCRIIAHISNDSNKWGAGFTGALSKKWPQPEKHFRSLGGGAELLGMVYFIQVDPKENIWVANMVAQHGVGMSNGPPIRYHSLALCLTKLNKFAKERGAAIHGPRFGSQLSGGDWKVISKLIDEHVTDVPVFIYELP